MSTLYELRNIEHYFDDRRVLNIKSLTLESNQIVGFFGPNGSGKSTLFSLLSFIDEPSSGELNYDGHEASELSHELKREVVMVPQNPYLLKRSVYDNVAYGLKLRNDNHDVKARVLEALALVGLDESFAKRKHSQLSGGEAQRVALAARLILKPRVLILDEPTTGVDTNSAQMIKDAIFLAKQKWQTTILISSHDHTWLNHACDRKVALFQGNLIESGNANLLYAPWEKDAQGNLIKFFLDRQALIIQNSADKKRDSVAIIDSDDIRLCRKDCREMIGDATMIGTIASILQQQSIDHVLVEFTIGGVSFHCRVTRDEMQEQNFLPNDRVYVNIDTSNVHWI